MNIAALPLQTKLLLFLMALHVICKALYVNGNTEVTEVLVSSGLESSACIKYKVLFSKAVVTPEINMCMLL